MNSSSPDVQAWLFVASTIESILATKYRILPRLQDLIKVSSQLGITAAAAQTALCFKWFGLRPNAPAPTVRAVSEYVMQVELDFYRNQDTNLIVRIYVAKDGVVVTESLAEIEFCIGDTDEDMLCMCSLAEDSILRRYPALTNTGELWRIVKLALQKN